MSQRRTKRTPQCDATHSVPRAVGPIARFAIVAAACLCVLAIGIISSAARADERFHEFTRKLQEGGYADVAIEYLRSIERRDDLPAEFRELLDFEIARTLLLHAAEVDAETEYRLLDESSKRLRKFLEEHADSDEANDALGDLASAHIKLGQKTLAKAGSERDADRRGPLRADARSHFEQARASLTAAVSEYRDELKAASSAAEPAKSDANPKAKPDTKGKSKTPPKTAAKKIAKPQAKQPQPSDERVARVENSLFLARLNLAIVEFFTARTLDVAIDAEKVQRKVMLDKAAQDFDALFQQYRGSFASLLPHLWHGRTLEEQGDLRQALMLYDEVLPNEPPKGTHVAKEQTSLFSQAEVFRLSVLNKQQKHVEAIADAKAWLIEHPDRVRTPHGLGVSLELAKANIALGEKLPAGSDDRRGAFARVMSLLNGDVTRLPSPYQDEAFRLRQHYAVEVTAGGAIASFDEGQFLGDVAIGKEQWADAIVAYEQALALATATTDEEERDATTYRLGFAYLRRGDYDKASQICEDLARSKPAARWAPDAAGVALAAYTGAYNAAKTNQEKAAEMVKLASIAKYLDERWPQHSQADSARRTMAGVLLYRREFQAAADFYERIKPGSPFYADAQTKSGQAYWSAYLGELVKPNAERDKDAMTRWLAAAKTALARSVATQKSARDSSAQASAGQVEAQLLAAEIELKTGSPANATTLLGPLVPLVQSAGREDLAPYTTRILVGAMESAIALDELGRAESLMTAIEKQAGSDTAQVTQVLVGLGRGLEQQLRQHEADGHAAEAESVRKSFETFLEKLANREQQTFASLQYLAECYFALGDFEKAAGLFEHMVRLANADPTFAQTKGSQSELLRVRLRRATALRLTKKFQTAMIEIDALLHENERLLAAIMERGRVLQDWGAVDSAKHSDAAKHWDATSRKLQNASPRPAEYFEARYGLAFCLAKSGKKDDAVRVLRSTITLSPAVGGGDMRAKYESLLKELDPAGATASPKPASGPASAPAGNP